MYWRVQEAVGGGLYIDHPGIFHSAEAARRSIKFSPHFSDRDWPRLRLAEYTPNTYEVGGEETGRYEEI
jgi:hypothetical protein